MPGFFFSINMPKPFWIGIGGQDKDYTPTLDERRKNTYRLSNENRSFHPKEASMKTMVCFALLVAALAGCGVTDPGTEETPTAWIAVTSSPDGAPIWLDGKSSGKITPDTLRAVPVGQHTIRVLLRGYEAFEKIVDVKEWQDSYHVSASLHGAQGSIVVTSQPSSAIILIDHEATGRVTPATFERTHRKAIAIRLLHKGYFPFEAADTLIGGEEQRIDAVLTPIPAGYTIAYRDESAIMTVSLDCIDPKQIASDAYPRGLQWSPTGELLTYHTNDAITILTKDGTRLQSQAYSAGARFTDYRWSHAGDKLVHGAYTDGIYLYDRTRNAFQKIIQTNGYRYDHNPVFSPDDRRIAFVHHQFESHAWIMLANSDGSNVESVSDEFRTSYDETLNLHWLSDHELVFKISSVGIHILDLNTRQMTLVLPFENEVIPVSRISISPDGNRFAYTYDGVQLGTVGQWASLTKISNGWDFTWVPGSDAVILGDWWREPDGTQFHLVGGPSLAVAHTQ